MFDMNSIAKRYFSIKLKATDEEGQEHSVELEVEPPKIKTLKRLVAVGKMQNDDSITELGEAVRELLSKNKSGYKVPEDYIDALDFNQMKEIIEAYFGWLSDVKNDPN